MPCISSLRIRNKSKHQAAMQRSTTTSFQTVLIAMVFVAYGCSSVVEPPESQLSDNSSVASDPIDSIPSRVAGSNDSISETDDPKTLSQPPKVNRDISWPNWMGAKHDGISHESGWSSEWPADGLPVVWSREIGIGFSSVSIANNRLFTMGHIDGFEQVVALKNETGEPIWSHKYECQLVDNLHEGGPGATPTIDGEFVYSLGREGQLFCLRAKSGDVVWSKSLQNDLELRMPEWGFTSSPYILGDQLILEAGRVVSYNKKTGEKNWQTDEHSAGYGSAIAFQHEGHTLLATFDCDGLRILEAANGEQVVFARWDSPFGTNSTTPIVKDGMIYVSSGYGVGCGLFRLKDSKLEMVYSNRRMRNHFNNSILLDGHVYGFDGNSNLGRVVQLKCMNFESGEVAWKQRGLGCGSLMIADGKLLILGEDGTLVLAKATPEGFQELARSPFLDGRCWTVPVLLNGRVYGRNADGKLICVRLPP